MKITTTLFEKLGLFNRSSGMNRENPRWQDLRPVSAIDQELKKRHLDQILQSEGGIGLLKEIYEEDDVIRILSELE